MLSSYPQIQNPGRFGGCGTIWPAGFGVGRLGLESLNAEPTIYVTLTMLLDLFKLHFSPM